MYFLFAYLRHCTMFEHIGLHSKYILTHQNQKCIITWKENFIEKVQIWCTNFVFWSAKVVLVPFFNFEFSMEISSYKKLEHDILKENSELKQVTKTKFSSCKKNKFRIKYVLFWWNLLREWIYDVFLVILKGLYLQNHRLSWSCTHPVDSCHHHKNSISKNEKENSRHKCKFDAKFIFLQRVKFVVEHFLCFELLIQISFSKKLKIDVSMKNSNAKNDVKQNSSASKNKIRIKFAFFDVFWTFFSSLYKPAGSCHRRKNSHHSCPLKFYCTPIDYNYLIR